MSHVRGCDGTDIHQTPKGEKRTFLAFAAGAAAAPSAAGAAAFLALGADFFLAADFFLGLVAWMLLLNGVGRLSLWVGKRALGDACRTTTTNHARVSHLLGGLLLGGLGLLGRLRELVGGLDLCMCVVGSG